MGDTNQPLDEVEQRAREAFNEVNKMADELLDIHTGLLDDLNGTDDELLTTGLLAAELTHRLDGSDIKWASFLLAVITDRLARKGDNHNV